MQEIGRQRKCELSSQRLWSGNYVAEGMRYLEVESDLLAEGSICCQYGRGLAPMKTLTVDGIGGGE